MNLFIVYAHPSEKSFTYQVLKSLIAGLKSSGHEVEISDLYQMNFCTDMTKDEYEREGLLDTSLSIPDDVIAEHRKIEKADAVIFLYPVWWSDCPAKLKGWFDRVYSVGYAYGHQKFEKEIAQMKKINYGLVLCTAGHPDDFLKETGIAESMRTAMLVDRLGVRFERKEMIILSGTLELDKVKNEHLRIAFEIGKNI
ncbi:MAG: NAD(P)H-dependent oxidoreductase [Candidatus Symbiothrix sp.]|jgi:NAD(P)H dehydrogenase (quinone)|nr:NAD(P)H-dependent oxidoreductase [Candidatus Symbiothrix sp.]